MQHAFNPGDTVRVLKGARVTSTNPKRPQFDARRSYLVIVEKVEEKVVQPALFSGMKPFIDGPKVVWRGGGGYRYRTNVKDVSRT